MQAPVIDCLEMFSASADCRQMKSIHLALQKKQTGKKKNTPQKLGLCIVNRFLGSHVEVGRDYINCIVPQVKGLGIILQEKIVDAIARGFGGFTG